jgi:hypothetical protein
VVDGYPTGPTGLRYGHLLVTVVITLLGIILVDREVPPPRLNFLPLRWTVIHDAVHWQLALR